MCTYNILTCLKSRKNQRTWSSSHEQSLAESPETTSAHLYCDLRHDTISLLLSGQMSSQNTMSVQEIIQHCFLYRMNDFSLTTIRTLWVGLNPSLGDNDILLEFILTLNSAEVSSRWRQFKKSPGQKMLVSMY